VVKHFGPRRYHARALPRCKDDDVKVQGTLIIALIGS
jgi:hypothetical protein